MKLFACGRWKSTCFHAHNISRWRVEAAWWPVCVHTVVGEWCEGYHGFHLSGLSHPPTPHPPSIPGHLSPIPHSSQQALQYIYSHTHTNPGQINSSHCVLPHIPTYNADTWLKLSLDDSVVCVKKCRSMISRHYRANSPQINIFFHYQLLNHIHFFSFFE